MPRLCPRIVRSAAREHILLPLLLPECRTVEQARQELQWIQNELPTKRSVVRACIARSRHVPLQYILGTQPFGLLNICCKPKVLIPRWETEEWAMDLIRGIIRAAMQTKKPILTIWDLCTGSGCIALLLRKELSQQGIDLEVTAVDVSPAAIQLTRENSKKLKIPIRILKSDILSDQLHLHTRSDQQIDILVSNPPYIKKSDFNKEVAISVKLFEPRLALVADLDFYENLIDQWLLKNGNVESFVYELGSLVQFNYVKYRIKSHPLLKTYWNVGLKFDSNGKPRCVYGFKTSNSFCKEIFKNFGSLIYRSTISK
ncbi:hypothetical protein NCAS_0G03010 [Naumovozyma castellii]|uniref:peptide chain release factor N(5)-glutamine methyltransferase n=1 Tax=Naumovozyma castellii TaxID=27288 RepID=G0VIF3_NAUCA|nr:hypothetical protein NCAS_0G03010 [Naumovozyma castellii CBS 4309]CCC71188.1 hypothetical protein NCAS_0G03010 [Naumovozyma castellii CBS 4309]